MIKEIVTSRHLVRDFVLAEFRGRYVESVLGYFWSIIQPLIQIAVYIVIFSVILKIKVGEQGGMIPFGTWLVAGIIPWMMVQDCLVRGSRVMIDNGNLIKKTRFHTSVLPFYLVITSLIESFIALFLFLILLIVLGNPPGPIALGVVFFIPFQILFCFGICVLVSSLNVFLRDVGQMIIPLSAIWFFGTPIVYPMDMAPRAIKILLSFNPMTHLVESYRDLLLNHSLPSLSSVSYYIAFVLIFYLAGKIVYRRTSPYFPDVV